MSADIEVLRRAEEMAWQSLLDAKAQTEPIIAEFGLNSSEYQRNQREIEERQRELDLIQKEREAAESGAATGDED